VSAAASDHIPKRLLVMRLGAMGDVIHTMHAVARLRNALPHVQLGWMIEERWSELLCAMGAARSGARSRTRPLVDFVHLVNTKAWRKSLLSSQTRRQFSSLLKEVRQQEYDLAVDFQGAIKSALLARLSRTERVLGMDRPRETPARMFYSALVRTQGPHVIDHYGELAAEVLSRYCPDQASRAITFSEPSLEFPHDATSEAKVSSRLNNITRRLVLLNPGAGWGAKQWPAERYGEISRELQKEGAIILVNYGPGEEQLARNVHSSSDGAAQPITCSLGELISLTRRASLFIGGDTGPLHLAAALGVPVVAIFGPTDPARNGPYGSKSVVIRKSASRTSLSHTHAPDPGLLQITSHEVLAAAHQLLEPRHG
jgi:lipopolysaccharide heptosyltransferase I